MKIVSENRLSGKTYFYTIVSRASKDPRQVFYGLEPGWIVNLKDKSICKPLDKELQDYYKS